MTSSKAMLALQNYMNKCCVYWYSSAQAQMCCSYVCEGFWARGGGGHIFLISH